MNTQRGRIIEKSAIQEGQTKSGGVWQSMTLVIEWGKEFVHDIAFRVTTKNIADVQALAIGTWVDIDYYVNSRKWQDKWFTDAELYAIRKAVFDDTQQGQAPQATEQIGKGWNTEPQDDDLPFD